MSTVSGLDKATVTRQAQLLHLQLTIENVKAILEKFVHLLEMLFGTAVTFLGSSAQTLKSRRESPRITVTGRIPSGRVSN